MVSWKKMIPILRLSSQHVYRYSHCFIKNRIHHIAPVTTCTNHQSHENKTRRWYTPVIRPQCIQQQSLYSYSTDYGLDQLRADIDNSFAVKDPDGQRTHGVGIGNKGKSLVSPFVNPDKHLHTEESSGGDGKVVSKSGKQPKVPSVTTILDKTKPFASRIALKKWEMKMIKQLGKEGFLKMKQELFARGKSHHQNIEGFLAGIPESEIPVTPNVAGFWKSVRPVLDDCKQIEMERRVTHPDLQYCGIVDCIGTYRDQLCVIEWKTSKKPKATLKDCYEYPLQAVAYAGALNHDPAFKFDKSISRALLVIAYEDGSPAHTHEMSTEMCEKYWSEWLAKILEYRDIVKKQEKT